MARKKELDTTSLLQYGTDQTDAAVQQDKPSRINPKSLDNLHPREKSECKTPKKYIQLDIIEFEDYLNMMSKYERVTRTRYIQNIIRRDYEANKEKYDLLKSLSKFD